MEPDNAHEVPRVPTDQLIDLMRDVLKGGNDFARWHVARMAGEWGIAELASDLVDLLGRPAVDLGDTDVRRISARALGELGFDTLQPYVTGSADSDNTLLREGIADALGETRDPRALSALLRLIVDPDDSVSMWACLSASKLGETAAPPLAEMLSGDLTLQRKMYLLDALLKIGTDDAVDAVRSFKMKQEDADLASWLDSRLSSMAP